MNEEELLKHIDHFLRNLDNIGVEVSQKSLVPKMELRQPYMIRKTL